MTRRMEKRKEKLLLTPPLACERPRVLALGSKDHWAHFGASSDALQINRGDDADPISDFSFP